MPSRHALPIAALITALCAGCIEHQAPGIDPADAAADRGDVVDMAPPPVDAGPLDATPPDTTPDAIADADPDPDAGPPRPCPYASPDPLEVISLVRRPDDRLVHIHPCPGQPLEVFGVRLTDDTDSAFTIEPPPPGHADPQPVHIRFELFNPARVTGRLVIDTDQGPLEVPLVGDARENACPDAIDRIPALTYATPLDAITLDGSEAIDIDGPGLRPTRYEWVVTSRPDGSVSQPHESFYDPAQPANGGLEDDPTTPTAVFFADLEGVFTLELRVHDALGLDSLICHSAGRMTLVVGEPPPACDAARPCPLGVCRDGFCAQARCTGGTQRRCHAPCGEGAQLCVDGWTPCDSLPGPERCHDGLDGDCDGRVDEGCPETECSDGADADADGFADFPADHGCASPGDVVEAGGPGPPLPQCANGFDDDRDGLIDLADPGCSSAADPREVDHEAPPACADGRDNDGDGRVDLLEDPGCSAAGDDTEDDRDPPPQCSNGLDDDGDGAVDYPDDPGCVGPGVRDEADPPGPPQCADGRDNDGDGAVDFPDDPQCASAAGASEG